jgi:uncharacterized iron-regulated membrane protein
MCLRSRTLRCQDSGLLTAFGLFFAVYAGIAFGFYWLMQPTVVKNGLAAYHPLPQTVVNYSDQPWVPPAPSSEVLAARASAEPIEVEQRSVAAPKIEAKPREVRRAPPRQRRQHVRTQPAWNYAQPRYFGFRPWF